VTGNLIWAVVGVVALLATAAVLALAETALTHMSTARADALEDEGVRGAGRLRRLLDQREGVLNPILLLLVACHLGIATIVTAVASNRFGAGGVIAALAVEVVVVFVLAEAVPKTYALQQPQQAALRVTPVARGLAAFWPLRWITRALVGLTNLVLPGRREAGPTVTEEELLAMAGAAADAEVI
jgi:Mg2+/Co2+ transporter CorB